MKNLNYFKQKVNEELADLDKLTVTKDGKTTVYKSSEKSKSVKDDNKENLDDPKENSEN